MHYISMRGKRKIAAIRTKKIVRNVLRMKAFFFSAGPVAGPAHAKRVADYRVVGNKLNTRHIALRNPGALGSDSPQVICSSWSYSRNKVAAISIGSADIYKTLHVNHSRYANPWRLATAA